MRGSRRRGPACLRHGHRRGNCRGDGAASRVNGERSRSTCTMAAAAAARGRGEKNGGGSAQRHDRGAAGKRALRRHDDDKALLDKRPRALGRGTRASATTAARDRKSGMVVTMAHSRWRLACRSTRWRPMRGCAAYNGDGPYGLGSLVGTSEGRRTARAAWAGRRGREDFDAAQT